MKKTSTKLLSTGTEISCARIRAIRRSYLAGQANVETGFEEGTEEHELSCHNAGLQGAARCNAAENLTENEIDEIVSL